MKEACQPEPHVDELDLPHQGWISVAFQVVNGFQNFVIPLADLSTPVPAGKWQCVDPIWHPYNYMGVSKNNGKTPQIILTLIGFSIIFTIHFGGKPSLFLETPICEQVFAEALEKGHSVKACGYQLPWASGTSVKPKG